MDWVTIIRVGYVFSAIGSGWGLWVMRDEIPGAGTPWATFQILLSIFLPGANTLDAIMYGIVIYRRRQRGKQPPVLIEGCILSSADDFYGGRFSPGDVEQAYHAVLRKGTLGIRGIQTPLTHVWIDTTPDGDKELWVAWDAPRGAGKDEERWIGKNTPNVRTAGRLRI